MEYKDTIFLPKTSFEMRANLPSKEPAIIEEWDKENIFKKLRDKSKGREKFVLHDGPPYANGNIHMGCLLYTSPSPRDTPISRMPSSA